MSKISDRMVERAVRKNTWAVKQSDEMKLVLSPLLMEIPFITHAFTTRFGGSTKAPFDSFNLGRSVGDDEVKKDAMANRRKLCRSLGVDFDKLVVPGQIHSANVAVVDHCPAPDVTGVDGLVTRTGSIPLLLHFADCVPVIVADRASKVIGIFHAGWRGTAASIVANGVRVMISEMGADPRHMIAAVGPAIGPCCYPTSPEVAQALVKTIGATKGISGLVSEYRGQPAPDLKALNAMQLLELGVSAVDVSDLCTACNPDWFYSHRQSGGTTGRQGALVSLTM